MTKIDEQIKAGMRRLVAEKGHKVNFEEPWWEGEEPRVSTYGWQDFDASYHILGKHGLGGPCEWIVPEGTVVTEQTYSMFDGTFTGNKNEVGLNAPGCRCKCGKYTDVTLRVTSSLGEAIQALIGYDSTKRMEL